MPDSELSQPTIARKSGRAHTILVVITAAVVGAAVAWGIWQRWSEYASKSLRGEEANNGASDAAMESRIRAFCGDCHAVPRPESFARDVWPAEVEKGYQHYVQSGRTDLDSPPMARTVAFFSSRAPEMIAYPEPKEADAPLAASFQPERLELQLEPGEKASPAIAGLCWTVLRAKGPPVLVVSDMFSGKVSALDLGSADRKLRVLAQLNNPCRLEPCDLDGDGAIDLLVADLGSYNAKDHDRGRAVWLRQDGRTGQFKEVVLASGLGRVADVRPIRLGSSGNLGLVVAEFGWNLTGRVLLLKNVAPPGGTPPGGTPPGGTPPGGTPRFEAEVLDPRAGSIHVPVCDLNQDGRMDILALVSNESESVEAFLGQGNGKFHRQTLWRAPDLTFGSAGIEVVDLDGDGDLDILYVNGDAFDNMYVTPWHGAQWLENLGGMQFKYHRLTDMSGAEIVRAGDFDGDGDADVLLAAFLPPGMKPDWLAARPLPSLVLLEQTSRGQFVRHTLERGFPAHAAVVVGDFDHDGRLDFAVGNHAGGHRAAELGRNWLTIWWNRGKTERQR